MPELPEVETTARGLNKKVLGLKILDFWTDWPKYLKTPKTERDFKKCVKGKKILDFNRRGKNLLIKLSGNTTILIHQKMTGHLLYGKWEKGSDVKVKDKKLLEKLGVGWEKEKWLPTPFSGDLTDPKNKFIRSIFFLDNGKMLALSDLRRFAKIMCGPTEEIMSLPEIKSLGPEPLEKSFTFAKFKRLIKGDPEAKIRGKTGKIKQVLMDQNFIVGVGNIYADEILYLAKIHPLSKVEKLKDTQLKAIYNQMKKVLTKAVKTRGTSIDDFRDPMGAKGKYGELLLVYQKTGQKCPKGHKIERIRINSRSSHFCPKEQKLYK